MRDYEVAFIYGTFSAVTLPIGALFGIIFTNISQEGIALGIAFGAGSLLFAVTVELYGDAIERLERRHFKTTGVIEILATLLGALVGAGVYILLCRWLDYILPGIPVENSESAPFIMKQQGPLSTGGISSIEASSESEGHPETSPESARVVERARGRKRAVMGVLVREFVRQSSHDGEAVVGNYGATWSDNHSSAESSNASVPHAQVDENRRVCCSDDIADYVSNMRVAAGIWLGVLLDGIPESIMLGYLAAEHKLSFALVIALLISNFPESFSSAALLTRCGVERWKIMLMWTVLCLMTGIIAMVTAYLLPSDLIEKPGVYNPEYVYLRIVGAVIEGMAGGAMLACISNVMLPDAFQRRGDLVGFFVLVGFVVVCVVKVFGGVIEEGMQ